MRDDNRTSKLQPGQSLEWRFDILVIASCGEVRSGAHPGTGFISTRRVALNLSEFDLDMDHNELRAQLRCASLGHGQMSDHRFQKRPRTVRAAAIVRSLQNIRYTLIPTIVVPIALLGTCAVMLATGFSINVLTMFAMVLAIGILVDDAIVVVENVERLMAREALSPRDATRKPHLSNRYWTY